MTIKEDNMEITKTINESEATLSVEGKCGGLA